VGRLSRLAVGARQANSLKGGLPRINTGKLMNMQYFNEAQKEANDNGAKI